MVKEDFLIGSVYCFIFPFVKIKKKIIELGLQFFLITLFSLKDILKNLSK